MKYCTFLTATYYVQHSKKHDLVTRFVCIWTYYYWNISIAHFKLKYIM